MKYNNELQIIDNQNKSYLLGLFYADGNISKNQHHSKLYLKDKELIDKLKLEFPFFNSYSRDNSLFGIQSGKKEVRNHFILNGCLPDKSISNKNNLVLPFRNELTKHFIRGYFDGDGCFTYSIRKPSKANREINYRVSARWEICSKKSNILLEIQKYLAKYEITTNINYNKRDDMYSIRTCSREQIIKIYNLLFKDSKYFLSRKYNKLKYYVNTEVVQIIRDHRNAQVMNDRESNNLPTSTEVDNLYDNDYYENNYYDYL